MSTEEMDQALLALSKALNLALAAVIGETNPEDISQETWDLISKADLKAKEVCELNQNKITSKSQL